MKLTHNFFLACMRVLVNIFPKKENCITFYSKPDFSDNSRAVYEELLHVNKSYNIVWLINRNPKDLSSRYPGITFIKKDSVAGFLQFAKSKYIFRSHMLYGNVRSKKQVITLLWHGMGIKGPIDFNMPQDTVDYISVTSDFYKFKLATRMNCHPSHAIITGLPRNDFMFQGKGAECLRNLPKVADNSDCKTVLWMPTYHRDSETGDHHGKYYELGIPVVKSNDLENLNTLLQKENIVLLIKLHPHLIGKGGINKVDYSNIQVFDDSYLPAECSLYHLLGGVDALITDYSSVYTDFMLLNRPIAFVYDDFEEYSKEPGFAFERVKMMMPGPHITEYSEFELFIKSLAEGKDEFADERNNLNRFINYYNDGNSSKRVLTKLGLVDSSTNMEE